MGKKNETGDGRNVLTTLTRRAVPVLARELNSDSLASELDENKGEKKRRGGGEDDGLEQEEAARRRRMRGKNDVLASCGWWGRD